MYKILKIEGDTILLGDEDKKSLLSAKRTLVTTIRKLEMWCKCFRMMILCLW